MMMLIVVVVMMMRRRNYDDVDEGHSYGVIVEMTMRIIVGRRRKKNDTGKTLGLCMHDIYLIHYMLS